MKGGKKQKMKEQEVAEWFNIFNWIQANSDIEVSFPRIRLPTILVVSYEIQVLCAISNCLRVSS